MQGKIAAFIAGTFLSVSLCSTVSASITLVRTPPRPYPGHPHTAGRTYPQTAQFCREHGAVRLELTIDERGRVVASRVDDSSGHRDLDLAAQQAVRTWQYLPATLDGKPVKARWPVNVLYKMNEPVSLSDRAISWGCRLVERLTGR
jgi:TonB family protein